MLIRANPFLTGSIAILLTLTSILPSEVVLAQSFADEFRSIMSAESLGSGGGQQLSEEHRNRTLKALENQKGLLKDLLAKWRLTDLNSEQDLLAYGMASEKAADQVQWEAACKKLSTLDIRIPQSYALLLRNELAKSNVPGAIHWMSKLETNRAYPVMYAPYWFGIACVQVRQEPQQAVASALRYIDSRTQMASTIPDALNVLFGTVPLFSRQLLIDPVANQLWQDGLVRRAVELQKLPSHQNPTAIVQMAETLLMVYGAERISTDWVESKLRSKTDCIDLLIEASYKWENPEKVRSVCKQILHELEDQEYSQGDKSAKELVNKRAAGLHELLDRCDAASQMQICVGKEFRALASLEKCLVIVQNDEHAMDLSRSSIARLRSSKGMPILVVSDNGSKRELSSEGTEPDPQLNISIEVADLHGIDELPKLPLTCGLLRNGRAIFWGDGASPHMIMHMVRLAN
ncbi:MAG: hypothetical protein U0930_10625 [Pirellulales bacterium]